MNLWTFLDRNSGGIFWLVVIALCFAYGECGSDRNKREGCHMQCGNAVMSTGPLDAGAE